MGQVRDRKLMRLLTGANKWLSPVETLHVTVTRVIAETQ